MPDAASPDAIIRHDTFGMPVTLPCGASLSSWNATQQGFLAHAAITPDHLARTLNVAPDFALGHAAKGLFCGLLGRREMGAQACASEADARRAAAMTGMTPRETVVLDALAHWNARNPSRAAEVLDAHLLTQPGDVLAMKLVQAIRFTIGDAHGMRKSIEAALPAYGPDHAAHGYALGCHAFTLEETGEYDRALAVGEAAVAHAPDDAWGLHAVAHVHDMRADSEAGIDWLTRKRGAWDHCNNFRFHVWWHLGLMHLERGEIDAVFALYDDHIRDQHTDDYRDISNATSLLSRLEVDGHDVGNRWDELADLCERRTEDNCLPFADLHYMLALVGGGRQQAAQRLLGAMRRSQAEENHEIARLYALPTADAATGLEAFGEGQFNTAFSHLVRAHPVMETIGGSHAQRDVFQRLTIEAGIRAGYHDTVRSLLDQRTAQRAGRADRFAAERYEQLDALKNAAE